MLHEGKILSTFGLDGLTCDVKVGHKTPSCARETSRLSQPSIGGGAQAPR